MSGFIKLLLGEAQSKRSVIAVSSMVMVSTICVSVAISYHLSMSGIRSSSKIHQETLEERHEFINKTIESVVSDLKQQLTISKTELASAKTKLQILARKSIVSDKKFRDLAKEILDKGTSDSSARTALQEALTEHIDTSSNNLNNRIDQLVKGAKMESLQIQKDRNGTELELDDIQESLFYQQKSISRIQVKEDSNSDIMNDIVEKMTNDREAVQNITKMYKNFVFVSKIISAANITNNTNFTDIINDMEDTLKLVEDNKVLEALNEYNKTIQTIISKQKIDTVEALDVVKVGIKKVYEGMRSFMFKSLGYVSLPAAGMYHIWNHQNKPFAEAKEHCEKVLGHIVEFQNKSEEDILLKYMRDNYEDPFSFWIGARDEGEEEKFVWENSRKELSFFNWHDGEPNNAGVGEDCVEVSNFQKWNDLDCDEYRLFVCEFDPQYELDISM